MTAIWQSLSVSNTKGGRRKCISYVSTTHTLLIHTEEFTKALYNLIDLKIIDLDEYQGLIDNFTTTEELDAYLTAREDMSFWYLRARGLTSVSPRDMMEEGISETQCFYGRSFISSAGVI